MRTPFILAAVLALFAHSAIAEGLGGFWKHAEEPGWIEIDMAAGTGTVLRNDKFPERVGRQILKDIESDGDAWSGQVYAEKLKEYKQAELTLDGEGRLQIKVKVGFLSRTVEWVRVDSVPTAVPGS